MRERRPRIRRFRLAGGVTLIRHDPAHLGETHRDLMDIFERVLREGGVFEDTDQPDTSEGAMWLKIAVADVDVLKGIASLSWRRLLSEKS